MLRHECEPMPLPVQVAILETVVQVDAELLESRHLG
jgi:hypothetical protein